MRSVMAMFVGVVFLVFGVVVAAEAPPVHGTIGRDVVEAGSHRDVAGIEAIAVDYEGYRYLFATEENAAAFRADPERFMVGAQGCCAKMGPLSGHGSTEIMLEHDGRVYLFASDSCRNTFSQAPEKHIDRDDRVPATSPDRAAEGRALIERAIAAHLGDGGLESVGVIEERFEEEVQHGDTAYRHVRW